MHAKAGRLSARARAAQHPRTLTALLWTKTDCNPHRAERLMCRLPSPQDQARSAPTHGRMAGRCDRPRLPHLASGPGARLLERRPCAPAAHRAGRESLAPDMASTPPRGGQRGSRSSSCALRRSGGLMRCVRTRNVDPCLPQTSATTRPTHAHLRGKARTQLSHASDRSCLLPPTSLASLRPHNVARAPTSIAPNNCASRPRTVTRQGAAGVFHLARNLPRATCAASRRKGRRSCRSCGPLPPQQNVVQTMS